MELLFKPVEVETNSKEVEEKPLAVRVEKPIRRNSSRIRDHLANERTYLAWM